MIHKFIYHQTKFVGIPCCLSLLEPQRSQQASPEEKQPASRHCILPHGDACHPTDSGEQRSADAVYRRSVVKLLFLESSPTEKILVNQLNIINN